MKLLTTTTNSKPLIKALTPILKKEEVKKEIGRRIIDAIRERTQAGFDKDGDKFKGYSKSYKESTLFKIWKGSQRTVDLILTGDMQANIDVVNITSNGCEIGFIDEKEELKAEGHIKGANYLPRRNFWGLPDKETLTKIMNSVIKDYSDSNLESQLEIINEGEKVSEVLFD